VKRPVVWVGLALGAGTYGAALGLCPGAVLPALLCVAGLALTIPMRRQASLRLVSILIAFAAVGALVWNLRHFGPPGDPLSRYSTARPERRYLLEGRVRRPNLHLAGAGYTSFLLDVDRVGVGGSTPVPLCGGLLVRWIEPGRPVYTDERVRVQGALKHTLGHVNPGIQDFEDYLRRRGIHSAVRVRGPEAVERTASGRWWRPGYWASRLRDLEARRLARAVPDSALPFVLTVWLGGRGQIQDQEYQVYVDSGTAHILAVSGIHIGIVFISVSFLLRLVIRNRRARTALTMGAVLLFALVAGARVSSLRAAIMIAFYLLADFFDREPDSPTALGIAGMLFLLVNPENLFDRAFLLSFSSLASILIFRGRINAILGSAPRFLRDGLISLFARVSPDLRDDRVTPFAPVPRGLQEGLAMTLSVQILPLPLAVHFFHVLPLVAPLVNLVVVPLLTVTLWLSFFTTLCALVSADIAMLFGHALAPIVALIRTVTELAAAAPAGHLRVVSPTAIAMVAYWGVVALLAGAVAAQARRRLWLAGAVALAGLAWLCWRPLDPEPAVVFLDVGHGDAIFIRTPGGDTVLVDGGDASEYVDMGARVVGPFLWSHQVDHLDYVILSHPDRDHIGGLFHVLDRSSVGCLILGPRDVGHPAEHALLERCVEHHIPVHRVRRGDRLNLAGATLDVLHPPENWPENSTVNDASLVLRLCWPGLEVLLTGDIEAQAEAALAPAIGHTAILKVPHHGSRTSSSPAFIDAVRPRVCIISTGGTHGRESVDPFVLRNYGMRGSTVLRTDLAGGITITLENGVPTFHSARSQRHYPVPSGFPMPAY